MNMQDGIAKSRAIANPLNHFMIGEGYVMHIIPRSEKAQNII